MGKTITGLLFLALTATAAACYVHEGPLPPTDAPPLAQSAPPPVAPGPHAPAPVAAPGAAPTPTPPVHPPITPQPIPPVQPSSVTSLGCYHDQGDPNGTSGRDLNGFFETVPGMTTEMCAQTCASKGFPYAATQYSTQCFCGTSFGKSGRADNCNQKCGGNQGETCGGVWANSVYQVKPAGPPPPPAPAPVTSVGCFHDQGDANGTTGRDLPGFAENVPGMTTEMCTQTCAAKGFQYAGTQYSTWCFCGPSYGHSGAADNCNMKCGGNQSETCGGAWANNVYKLR